jgi:hypothetical protein
MKIEKEDKMTQLIGYYFFKSFYIAGFSYYEGAFVFDELKIGTKLEIALDDSNEYDKNAVQISYKGKKLGYIPRETNQEVATLLQAGYNDIFMPIIQQIAPHSHPEKQVKVGLFILPKEKDLPVL